MQTEIKQRATVHPAVLSKWFMSRQNLLWRTHFLGLRWQSHTNHLSNVSAYCNGFLIRGCLCLRDNRPSIFILFVVTASLNCPGQAHRALVKLLKTLLMHVSYQPLTKPGSPSLAAYAQIISEELRHLNWLHWSLGTCRTVTGWGNTIICLCSEHGVCFWQWVPVVTGYRRLLFLPALQHL